MKIIYLIAGLYRPAGMERVISAKANYLARRGDDVSIVTTDQKGRPVAFELDSSVRLFDLGIGYEDNNGGSLFDKVIHYPFKIFCHRHRLTALLYRERADVVISTFCNDVSFVPGIRDGSHKVLEVHFSRYKRLQYGRHGLWALVDAVRSANDRRIVSRYERFVVLTEEDASYWGEIPGMRVIPNPISLSFDAPASTANRQVLAAGRYGYQKGFDMLIKAWGKLDTFGWTLRIAGEGSLGDIALQGNVITGPAADIRAEYMRSSIFALSSRYEGLPMVLLESQAAGLAAVCFECKCGPRDVVTDGEDGFLVPEGDIDAFAEALEKVMRDDELRGRMGAAAYRHSSRYELKRIMELWERLFAEL